MEDVVGVSIVEAMLVEVVSGTMTEEVVVAAIMLVEVIPELEAEEDDMDVVELIALLNSYTFKRLPPPHFSALFPGHGVLQSDAGAGTLPA